MLHQSAQQHTPSCMKVHLPLGTARETAPRPMANHGKLPRVWVHDLVSSHERRELRIQTLTISMPVIQNRCVCEVNRVRSRKVEGFC